MYLLPGNPFSQAVEAYRDSGEALLFKGHARAVPLPFIKACLKKTATFSETCNHLGLDPARQGVCN